MFTSIVWILRLQKAEEPERLETEDNRRHLLQVKRRVQRAGPAAAALHLGSALAGSRSFSCGQTRLFDLDLSRPSAHVSPQLGAVCWSTPPTPGSFGSGLEPLKRRKQQWQTGRMRRHGHRLETLESPKTTKEARTFDPPRPEPAGRGTSPAH